jgi:hypothetical protein
MPSCWRPARVQSLSPDVVHVNGRRRAPPGRPCGTAGRDVEPPDPVLLVPGIAEAVGHVDVHAIDGVDEVDEPGQVDLRPVVDLEVEQRPERRGEHRLPVLRARELARMPARVADEAVDLAPERAAVGQRHVDHVARDRDHRDRLADGSSDTTIIVSLSSVLRRRPSPSRSAARSRAAPRASPRGFGSGRARVVRLPRRPRIEREVGVVGFDRGRGRVGDPPPSATGWKTSSAAARASTVSPATTSWGRG